MKISVIGTGHVGLVTGACFAERGHHVLCVDVDKEKIARLRRGVLSIFEPGLEDLVRRNAKAGRLKFGTTNAEAVAFGTVVFICVPTPPRPDGTADLSFMESVSRDIAKSLKEYRLIVDKSTVPVHTGERVRQVITKHAPRGVEFDVASNPEFLREGAAVQDTLHPDRIVFGVESARAEKTLREAFEPFQAPILSTDIKSAELIKHASNSFLALKISYANALAAICDLAGADVQMVTRGMGMDRRIGLSFLNPGIGYGGSCFPKDVAAFEAISRELGFDFRLLREVQRLNEEAAARFLKKVEQELWILKGKKIAAFGLSFKPDTDDVRESVALKIVRALLDKGADVRAYDPQAMARAKAELPGLKTARSPYEAAKGADCALLLTEWKEFRELDLAKLRKTMAHPTMIDGRNVFDPGKMKKAGFAYQSIGRPSEDNVKPRKRTLERVDH
ncbi:MAG TPA: UDP-glucose/GDP-mannose dehydrogenase family protein [Planctomycetota bacterium]|nr:UDP-glucose/GDP-mannose dehydrogenase family protein [Planctomycetota bacterium]